MEKILKQIEKYLLIIGITVFPLFVLPGFPSPYHVPKIIFACTIASLVLIFSMSRCIAKGELKYAKGKFDLGVSLLALTYLVASIFATPNKMEAFFYPGTTTFVLISTVFYLIINQLSKKGKNSVLLALFTSGILLSIFTLFASLGVFAKIPQLPSFIKNSSFNPLGSMIHSLVYLLVLLPIGIIQAVKEKDTIKKVFFCVASAVIIFGSTLIAIDILPGKTQTPIFPSWQTSWFVAVDTLQESPLLGAGPGNYLTAFNRYRPLSYNQSNLWQVRFSSANNFYLTLITETGLIGMVVLIILLATIYKSIVAGYKNRVWEEVSLVILLAALVFLPASSALIFLLMVLLSVFSNSEENRITIASNKIPSIIATAPVFLVIIGLVVFGSRAVAAETKYQKALEALVENNAKDTYAYMTEAKRLNPYVDRYHASLSQIDMALANSIAAKENLTEDDRNSVSQLIQEAITEGKATVTLNPTRSDNWEILAQIYRNIMSFAEGSDQYAIETYSQAVALDPIDPDLRISLGGIYYALGDYESAINAFQLAVAAKNDHANAHYNLAVAYAADGDYDKAISQMGIVLSLVEKDSEDYKTALSTLDQMKKQKPAENDSVSKNLTLPETTEESAINPPIELPEDSTPPETQE